ncbi:MAG: hypothetical protein PHG85_02210 [Candidatus Altiarchaeota archaeon]|nr:hypothetical protein [Candidatus Altiarchaeota archaeon]
MEKSFAFLLLLVICSGCLGGKTESITTTTLQAKPDSAGISSPPPTDAQIQEVEMPDSEIAADSCVEACMRELAGGKDMRNGPCLSEQVIPDWVCDVAHSPREDVDNLPSNQCEAFGDGFAAHFVEVSPDCEILRVY